MVKVERPPGINLTDLGLRKPLREQFYRAIEAAGDATFNSCWHYELLRRIEPHCPVTFIYGKVDRTIRQAKIEEWIEERRAASGGTREVTTVVTDSSGHVEHFWKARARYCVAVDAMLARSAKQRCQVTVY